MTAKDVKLRIKQSAFTHALFHDVFYYLISVPKRVQTVSTRNLNEFLVFY